MIRKGYLCLWVIAAGLLASVPAVARAEPGASDWAHEDQVQVRLVSATVATGSAETQRLGLQFRMQPGWKIYWRSPGDAGFPPRPDWSGSNNLASADLRWPAPERFDLFGLETFGYGGEVVLPIDARLARPGDAASLALKVDYLTCEKICIPYEASLSLALPAGPAGPSAFAHLIDRFNVRVPGDGAGQGLTIERADWIGGPSPAIAVTVRAMMPLATPDVLIEGPAGWTFGRPTAMFSDGGRSAVLRAPARAAGRAAAAELAGSAMTLTVLDGERAVERQLTLGLAPSSSAFDVSFLAILGLAVLGGFILNLMPCVLPVLSLKLLGLVGHGGAGRTRVRLGFLASAAGILTAFLALAAALVGVQAAGYAVGWGIQFQQPVFLVFMALLLTLFAANLWGWFEIRLPGGLSDMFGRVGGADDHGQPTVAGSFATGAFATLLATPCSAPFLGTAVGFALARGPGEIFAVFAALGIGLALPYLVVAALPGIAARLPRPGRWMIGMRRILGLALAATVIWLLTVVAAQLDSAAAMTLAGLLAALLVFLWAMRNLGDRGGFRRVAGIAALATLAFIVPGKLTSNATPAVATKAGPEQWRPFDRDEIGRLVAADQVVFVDVTADWCITCQVNKALVLSRGDVAERLSGKKAPTANAVIAMRADWTKPDDRIARYLASFGRYGIPFNAVYGPGAPQGLPLPEILTAEAVLTALDRAAMPMPATAAAR
ncbi:MAG: thioredoxin family protein [Rhodospirillales bacterium]|nr:thioredoxin family protein [Rhodospirillales bacterium]